MSGQDAVDVFGGDETFVAVAPAALKPRIADPVAHRGCWPDLHLEVSRDRGEKGLQWVVSGAAGGTAEVWLEPWHDGTIVHLYLRLRVVPDRRGRVRPAAVEREQSWRRWITGVKDEFDAVRTAGSAPAANR